MGGGNICGDCLKAYAEGLSPRGRGKQDNMTTLEYVGRSIPAWAGETVPLLAKAISHWVYPRVGGGNRRKVKRFIRHNGLSPRGRGKPMVRLCNRAGYRSIPAWEGETSGCRGLVRQSGVYPRVGGGNGEHTCYKIRGGGLSPRGRGKLHSILVVSNIPRSIPAWAGETSTTLVSNPGMGVYPRVGGGNWFLSVPPCCMMGLSPRGRGKQHIWGYRGNYSRSIPAWAGETTGHRRRYQPG